MASRASDEGRAGGCEREVVPGGSCYSSFGRSRPSAVHPRLEGSVTPGHARVADCDLHAVLWRLLAVAHRDDDAAFLPALDDADEALSETDQPLWVAWRHAVTARRSVL